MTWRVASPSLPENAPWPPVESAATWRTCSRSGVPSWSASHIDRSSVTTHHLSVPAAKRKFAPEPVPVPVPVPEPVPVPVPVPAVAPGATGLTYS